MHHVDESGYEGLFPVQYSWVFYFIFSLRRLDVEGEWVGEKVRKKCKNVVNLNSSLDSFITFLKFTSNLTGADLHNNSNFIKTNNILLIGSIVALYLSHYF